MTYLSLLPFAPPMSINGMFYVLKTETLKQIGGWTQIEHQLCDDYAFAKLVKQRGLTITQGTTPQHLHTTVANSSSYFQIMHRWFLFANVLVKDQIISNKCLLLVCLGLPPLLLWIVMISLTQSWIGIACIPGLLLLRHVLISNLLNRTCGNIAPLNWPASIVVELLQPLHWFHATIWRRIRWRNRRIQLTSGGQFNYLD